MKQGPTDPAIDAVREVRHRISERVGHDPARLVAYYMELQRQFPSRLVGVDRTEGADVPAGDDPGRAASCSEPAGSRH
jgi:hypothetical protein